MSPSYLDTIARYDQLYTLSPHAGCDMRHVLSAMSDEYELCGILCLPVISEFAQFVMKFILLSRTSFSPRKYPSIQECGMVLSSFDLIFCSEPSAADYDIY